MFRILVIEDRLSIQLGLKHLLSRYELIFARDKEADNLLEKNHVDLVLINTAKHNGLYSNWNTMQKWASIKKMIVISDHYGDGLNDRVRRCGAIKCIDKLDIDKLPRLVEKCLNKADTRIIDVLSIFNN